MTALLGSEALGVPNLRNLNPPPIDHFFRTSRAFACEWVRLCPARWPKSFECWRSRCISAPRGVFGCSWGSPWGESGSIELRATSDSSNGRKRCKRVDQAPRPPLAMHVAQVVPCSMIRFPFVPCCLKLRGSFDASPLLEASADDRRPRSRRVSTEGRNSGAFWGDGRIPLGWEDPPASQARRNQH